MLLPKSYGFSTYSVMLGFLSLQLLSFSVIILGQLNYLSCDNETYSNRLYTISFVIELHASRALVVKFLSSEDQIADVLTKQALV
jgi:hypothetical protein